MVESIKELRKICYAGSKDKRPLYMELVTMKISIYVTKLLLYTPIHANQVTILTILFIILGSGMMISGSLWIMFIGITLIHLTIILDNVDGEIARYRKEASLTGLFIDEFYHTITIPLVFFSFSYGIFLNTEWKSTIIFGFLCAIFAAPIVLNSIKTAVIKKELDRLKSKEGMLPKKYILLKEKINLKGGSTKLGSKLYSTFDVIKEFLRFPFNIAHIHIILIIELINNYYNFMPEFLLSSIYLIVYGSISVLVQLISFIVHYKGRTIFHYYNALFNKK